MIITDTKEIYEKMEVGDTIAYYMDANKNEGHLKIHIIEEIEKCSSRDDTCETASGKVKCYNHIHVNGKKNCFFYYDSSDDLFSVIKYIIKKEEFLTEEEMMI